MNSKRSSTFLRGRFVPNSRPSYINTKCGVGPCKDSLGRIVGPDCVRTEYSVGAGLKISEMRLAELDLHGIGWRTELDPHRILCRPNPAKLARLAGRPAPTLRSKVAEPRDDQIADCLGLLSLRQTVRGVAMCSRDVAQHTYLQTIRALAEHTTSNRPV